MSRLNGNPVISNSLNNSFTISMGFHGLEKSQINMFLSSTVVIKPRRAWQYNCPNPILYWEPLAQFYEAYHKSPQLWADLRSRFSVREYRTGSKNGISRCHRFIGLRPFSGSHPLQPVMEGIKNTATGLNCK